MNVGNDIQDQRTKRKQWPRPSALSQVMAWIGRHTSPRKASASRANGLSGGRPRLDLGAMTDRQKRRRARYEEALRQAITRATAKQGEVK